MKIHCSIRVGATMIVLFLTFVGAHVIENGKVRGSVSVQKERDDPGNLGATIELARDASDCDEILKTSATRPLSGVYTIQPPGVREPFHAFCDFDTDDDGWTVIQRRTDGSVNFNLDWYDYKEGFGDMETEFWLGLDKIYSMTEQKRYQLRIELTNHHGTSYYAKYSHFSIGDAGHYYRLSVGTYSGNSDDALYYHNGMYFSTKDADRDHYSGNCAESYGSGWWYNSCYHSQLNNYLGDWSGLPGSTSVKFSEMKIREAPVSQTEESNHARDCDEILEGSAIRPTSGVYTLQPPGEGEPFDAYCDFDTDNGGWTVIQRRTDGFVSFDRDWTDYKVGFGNVKTEFWLGNEKIFSMTKQKKYELRIDLSNRYGDLYYAKYSHFSIRGEDYHYRLNIGAYSGNSHDSLSYHNGMYFTTTDADHDQRNGTCASSYTGGWWFNDCYQSLLNGRYQTSYFRWNYLPGYQYYLKFAEMKIRGVGPTGVPVLNYARDCEEIGKRSAIEPLSGVYTIQPVSMTGPFEVYCDFDADGGGWTVIQRRTDGSVNFNVVWNDYRAGFGNLKGEFWLGNDKLYSITEQKRYQLRIELTNEYGLHYHAKYSYFSIGDSSEYYKLSVGTYTGNSNDALSYNNGMQFTTRDVDHDQDSSNNCAATYGSGWWYKSCYQSMLNKYHGIWIGLPGHSHVMFSEMKIRAVN